MDHKNSEPIDYKAVFEAIGTPLLIIDSEFTMLAVNEARVKATGVSAEQSFGRNHFDVFPDSPDDPFADGSTKLKASWNQVFQTKAPHRMAIQKYDIPVRGSQTGEFEERYWCPINFPIFDKFGNVKYLLHRVDDVTEEVLGKRRETMMATNEARAREVANKLPLMVWTARPDGFVDWYNDWWYEYLAIPRGTGWDSAEHQPMHPEDVALTKILWPKALAAKKPFNMEQRFRRASDGQYRWHLVRGVPVFDESGKVKKYVGGNTDIHDEKMLAEDLHKARLVAERESAKFEAAFHSVAEGMFIFDSEGNPVSMNDAAAKVVGSEKANDVKQKTEWFFERLDLFDMNDNLIPISEWPVSKVLRGESLREWNIKAHRRDTDDRWIWSASGELAKQPGLDITLAVVVLRDITASKAAESELQKSKDEADRANALKSAFLANMSHEIRTPLGAILGFSSLLKDRDLDPSEKDQYVNTILRNGNSLTRIIDDILDLAKVEAGRLEIENVPFSLYRLVNESVDSFRDKTMEKNIFLHLNIEDDVPLEIYSDPTRLRQILVNLIGNAVKFTINGGVLVTIRSVQTVGREQKITVDVKDSGIGLTSEQKEKLFSPFMQADNSMTRKFGGTGLGLALSERLSQALRGEISIAESELEKGSTFRLTFLANVREDETTSQNIAIDELGHESNSLKNVSILVVDDSEDNQFLVSRLLTKEGAKVETALDGREAVDKALQGSYDLILMDLQMPVLDGYQAKAELDKKSYTKPVFALTAHAMSEEREKTKAAGFAGHLTKPLMAAELFNTITLFINKE